MTGFVEIGSIGWEHEQWTNSYYPEDLPSDWLFSYYSKQFRTVWLTAPGLANKTTEEIQSCLDDCNHDFEFLIEIPVSDSPGVKNNVQQWVENTNLLKDHILAFVIPVIANLTAEYITELLARLKLAQTPDLFLLPEIGSTVVYDQFSTLNNLYELARADTLEKNSNTQILLIDFQSPNDMRALGKTLNTFVNQNSLHNKLYCFFEGKPPSYSLMQSAQTIVSLLDT